MKLFLIGITALLLSGCVLEEPTKVTVDMKNGVGDSIGTAILEETADGVEIALDLEGLPPGTLPSISMKKVHVNDLILFRREIISTPWKRNMDFFILKVPTQGIYPI